MVNRLAKCAADQADLHQLEWENRKRAEEIWELQKVTNAHVFVLIDWKEGCCIQGRNRYMGVVDSMEIFENL